MEAVAAVIALTAMEIVLGIDNIVFITAVAARLPEKDRHKARQWGLALAMVGIPFNEECGHASGRSSNHRTQDREPPDHLAT